jgi:hypothetical protein
MLLLEAPVLQVKELMPLAINVAALPAHTVAELTVITGEVAISTCVVAVLTQPALEVPATLYVVFAVGVTTNVAAVLPVFQE